MVCIQEAHAHYARRLEFWRVSLVDCLMLHGENRKL